MLVVLPKPLLRMLVLSIALVLGFSVSRVSVTPAYAQPSGDEASIRTTIDAQVAAWNRADIPAFMESYENSPETTFIGTKLNKGFAPILERYKKAYTSKEEMGTLTFSDLEIRLMPTTTGVTEYAIVTGHFHLARSARGEAKKDDGIFSLVWHKGPGGWKIMLDHTS
jgi:ketosteroid isomerase-like protein